MSGSLIRRPAPAFKAEAVVDGDIVPFSSDYFKGSYGVLFYYPLDHTFVCPTEITAFSDRIAEFSAIGCKVAAISVDSAHCHLSWINTPRSKGGLGKMNIPVIADLTKSISRAYGVLIEDEALGDAGVSYRATFIIDPKGIVRAVQVNDLPVGRSVDEVLRLVQAFQYTDVHGEVCPAGWKPGAATMVADPSKSKTYFESIYGGAAK